MAKIHNYTKYVKEPDKVVMVRLSDDETSDNLMDQCNGCWQAIGSTMETISQNLENSRPGSKFPLFHRIGSETPISRLEVSLFENELKTIRKELKKLPLSDSRLVIFKKNGKAVVRQISDEQLSEFKGYYSPESKPASNLYESFRLPIDLHARMCRQARKKETGLAWNVVSIKEVKSPATPAKKTSPKVNPKVMRAAKALKAERALSAK